MATPLTAEDVKYSFERVLDPAQEVAAVGNIRAIKEVRDPRCRDDPPRNGQAVPAPPRAGGVLPDRPQEARRESRRPGVRETAAVGTGPWKLVEWKRDQHIRLEAFDGHWRGKPVLQAPRLPRDPGGGHPVAELKTGGVDLIRNVSADLVPELKTRVRRPTSSSPILRVHYVHMDMRTPPFNKKLVRQAANYAIDQQAIIQKLMGGLGRQVGRQSSSRRPSATTRGSPRTPMTRRRPRSSWPRPAIRTAWTSRCTAPSSSSGPVFEAIAQMLTDVAAPYQRPDVGPGPGLEQVLPGGGEGHPRLLRELGELLGLRRRCRSFIPSTTPSRAAGSVSGIPGSRSSTAHRPGAGHRWTRRSASDPTRRSSSDPRGRAVHLPVPPSSTTSGISKKVSTPARGDEWLWLFDAKPKP